MSNNPNKASVWIEAMRLRTLPLSAAGIITGSAMALRDGQFDSSIFTLALFTTLFLQILSNLANDYGDAMKGTDDESRIGPRRMVASGFLKSSEIKGGIILFGSLAFITGIGLLITAFGIDKWKWFLIFLAFGLLSIWAAIKYTVGKSAYGYSGFGDLFVFLFFGILSVSGSYFLYTMNISTGSLLQSIAIGCLSTGVLHLNNMRDREADQASNKITVAVKLGFEKSKIYFYVLILVAVIAAFLDSLIVSSLQPISFIAFFPFFMIMVKVNGITELAKFNALLKPLALSTFFYALLVLIGISL